MAAAPLIATSVARPLLAVAEEAGLARADLLARLGVSEAELADPERQMPIAPYLELWAHVARTVDDPGLPMRVAARVQVGDYHVLGFAIMTSASGREAVVRGLRYLRLYTNAGAWTLDDDAEAGLAIFRWHRPLPLTLGHRLANECVVAECLRTIAEVSGQPPRPRWVRFRHPAPRDIRALERALGVRPSFGASDDGFALDATALAFVPAQANPSLHQFVVAQAEARLQQLDATTPLGERVQAEIVRLLPSGEPSMAAVARQAGMSERTLRRQLAADGKGFRQLVDDARRARAVELMSRPTTVAEAAFLLGFAEVGAFSRAFKRWFGASPREYARRSARWRELT